MAWISIGKKQEEATKPLRNRLQIIETMLQSEQSKI
jgi:hypothetical protein